MNLNLMRRNRTTPGFPSLIEEFFNEPFVMVAPIGAEAQPLAVDVSETDKEVLVRASVPGFTKDQVTIEVNDDVLTITAEKSEEVEEKNERFIRRERRAGRLIRSLPLPSPVADDKARAELKDGVLTVAIPKNPRVLPKKISISG
ncbi:MAG: Hsp20/alpha crystallin family protein [Phycisphaerales bacterium]